MCTQQFDIVVALTQRRDLNRNNRQAVVQVFAESAVLNHPLQIAVSSCQNSTVGSNGGAAADSFEGFFLQRMQYTRLGCKTHIADFVEKKRAAMCHFELALAHRLGVGKSAGFMTEEFRLYQ